MEAVKLISLENDKIISGLESWTKLTMGKLDALERQIDAALEQDTDGGSKVRDVKKIAQRAKSDGSQISIKHKEIHQPVSKMGKTIDKQFEPGGANIVGVSGVFDDVTRHHLVKSVIEHLYCSGLSHVAHELEKESGFESENKDRKEKFLFLTDLLTDLRNGKNDKLLDWIYTHRAKLAEKNSFIEWKIRRLEFCQMLMSPNVPPVIQLIKAGQVLAQTRCDQEANSKELQQLMTAILYRNKMDACPYNSLIQTFLNSTAEICDDLMNDFGYVNSMPELSYEHLVSAHSAGCIALPALVGIKSVMEQRNIYQSAKDELPIEIELPKRLRYHSVFSCPILRQQTTVSNPPMRLKCGHVISKEALDKLTTQASHSNNTIKCPYCPTEQRAADAEKLFF